jgi:hypothetical protein
VALNSRLAKIARIAAKITGALIAFVMLFVLACFIVNSFDAPLSEQAKALLTPPPNPYPAEQNIYLALAGLDGGAERPIIEMGQERIEAYNRALDSMLLNPESALELNKQWDAAKLKVDGKVEELGHPRSSAIWTTSKTHRQDIAALLTSNQILYQRYLFLHRLKGYYETARPSFMAPVINPPPAMRTLFLANVANRLQTGTAQEQREALNELERDLQLWRNMLKGEGTLISKMLSVAYLHGDMILLADLLTDPSFNSGNIEELLDAMLPPFDLKDFAIGNASAAEFRSAAPTYRSISAANEMAYDAHLGWWSRIWNAFQAHFFKLNATENMNAEIAARWVAVGDSQPREFQQASQAQRKWLDKKEPHLSPSYFYNPVGKILVSIAGVKYADYSLRAYDVAAYQRLVYLVYQLKHQHIATADVAAFMQAHPEWSTNPVDDNPFRWNAETGEIAVNTLGENSKERRFSVILPLTSHDQRH